jgi:hypothetical protein
MVDASFFDRDLKILLTLFNGFFCFILKLNDIYQNLKVEILNFKASKEK